MKNIHWWSQCTLGLPFKEAIWQYVFWLKIFMLEIIMQKKIKKILKKKSN